MEVIRLGSYDILLTGKAEGSSYDKNNSIHTHYYSITQVHEHTLVIVDDVKYGWDNRVHGDALMSDICPLGVHTADCLPIALLGKKYYAVVHGSWKTLGAGIGEHTVKNLCRQGEVVVDMDVYIGPSIRGSVYEVGTEFYDYFPHAFLSKKDNKLLFDMVGYTTYVLQGLGVDLSRIIIHQDCTYMRNDIRRSWRRGDQQGRNFMGVKRVL